MLFFASLIGTFESDERGANAASLIVTTIAIAEAIVLLAMLVF